MALTKSSGPAPNRADDWRHGPARMARIRGRFHRIRRRYIGAARPTFAVGGSAICIEMIVALWKGQWHNGLMGSPDRPGYELPLATAALAFALIFFGSGPISLDQVLSGSPARK